MRQAVAVPSGSGPADRLYLRRDRQHRGALTRMRVDVSAEGLIRRARAFRGLRQKELAELLDVGKSTVSAAESIRNPSCAQLERYGKAMGLELRVFYLAEDGRLID
jgi:ribosome-binding protein aMBF1 (putative translation factor)